MRFTTLLAISLVAGLAAGALLAGAAGGLIPDAGTHGAWYASRAAGIASYLFVWVGLAGGLMMSSAWFDGIIGRARLLAIHQSASIAGVVLGLGHGLVLIPDGWTDFTLVDVLVPFASDYARAETALGTIALYLGAIVTFSFWVRGSIGPAMWRRIHRAAFVMYVAALWHGLQLGTDSREPWLMGLYLMTSLAVVFAVVVRLTYARAPKKRATTGASVG